MPSKTNLNESEMSDILTRDEFAKLCNPVKHYLTDKIGMDDLNASCMATNIVDSQQQVIEKLFKDRPMPSKTTPNRK